MRFWQSVAFLETAQLLEVARASDAAGYHGITMSDHVVYPEKLSSLYPYSGDGSPPFDAATEWPDAWVTIAAMAAVTEHLRFTTNIFVAPARNPFLLAKAVATAATLSHGRVALGLSAGWMREEFDLLGQPFASRGKRLDEMIDVLRLLWSGGMVEHHGHHYDFDRVEMSPLPPAPVLIYAGGHSEAALARAANLDGWIGNAYLPEDAARILADLQRHRAAAGTLDRDDYEIVLGLIAWPDAKLCERFSALGVTGLLCAPWMTGPPSAAAAKLPLRDVLASIDRFAEAVVHPLAEVGG